MRLRTLAVGKPKQREFGSLHDLYAERIRRLDAEYDSAWVADVQAGGRFSDDHVREREARHLVAKLGERGRVVALDPGGTQVSSVELARRLERDAHVRATYVIGGPLGLHSSLLDRSDWRWSLSRLTLPHELARVVVAEQLYRALTILRGLPYHK